MTLMTDNPTGTDAQDAINAAIDHLQATADAKGATAGLAAGKVRVDRIDWAGILQSALWVDLSIGGTTFEKVLDPEDFGVVFDNDDERAAWKRTVRLGEVYAMTEVMMSKLANIKGRARARIKKYANQTKHFGNLIRLDSNDASKEPGSNFKEFYDGMVTLEGEYLGVGQYIYDNWDVLMDELRGDYKLIAVGVYSRMKQASTPNMQPLDAFIEAFVARRMSEIENKREAVKASFYWELDVTDIPLAAAVEQASVMNETIKANVTVLDEIKALKAQTANRLRGEGIDTLLKDLRAVTNDMILDVMVKTLNAIQTNGEVPGASVRGLRNLIENLNRIQLFPDEQVEQMVTEIRSLLALSSVNDNVVHTRNVVRRVAAEAKLVLMEFDRVPEKLVDTRDFGVPNTLAGLKRAVGFEARSGSRTMDLPVQVVPVTVSRDGERDF